MDDGNRTEAFRTLVDVHPALGRRAGRYDGKTLQELWPRIVDEVVHAVDPVEVIVTNTAEMAERAMTLARSCTGPPARGGRYLGGRVSSSLTQTQFSGGVATC